MTIARSFSRLACGLIFGVVFALVASSCATRSPEATRPRDEGVVASCVIRGDACVLTLENRTGESVEYFLLTRTGSFSRAPFFSKVFVRRPTGEVRECIGIARLSELLEMKTEQMQRVGATAGRTIALPLVDLWYLHQPSLGYFRDRPYASIDDLRADKAQFKISIDVYLDAACTKAVSCESDWHDF